jgi:hypothetical protein
MHDIQFLDALYRRREPCLMHGEILYINVRKINLMGKEIKIMTKSE